MNLTLFDLDGTLIAQDSDHAFGEYLVRRAWVDADTFKARNDAFFADYQAGRLDLHAYVEFATSGWRHRPLPEALALREAFMVEVMSPALQPQAHALVRRHLEAGDLVAIVTATNEFVTRPIASALGVEHLLAVQLEADAEGRYTGRVRGTPTFQAGKITRVEEWLRQRSLARGDFDAITVYSDSMNDLPLLEWATHPVATNPAPSLLKVAHERRWPVLQLFA